jgi:hypothetical protein
MQKVSFCFIIKAKQHKLLNIRFIDEQPATMKRNDSFSTNNQETKKPRTLSPDVATSEKITESASVDAASRRIDRPGPFDVICGRGRPYQEHQGNKRLHAIAAVHKPQYLVSKRRYKKGIAEMIVNSIKNDETEPGRFLKRIDDENNEVWEDVSDEVAREKVSHVLRFKCKSTDSPSEASSESDDASGIPGVNNMRGLQSNLATGGQRSQESLWKSRSLPAFALPDANMHTTSAGQPSRSSLNLQRAAFLNLQRPVGGFDMHNQATGGTAISGMSSGTVGASGAPITSSERSPAVDLLSNDQVFVLEALIHRRRRERKNNPGIAPAARFP